MSGLYCQITWLLPTSKKLKEAIRLNINYGEYPKETTKELSPYNGNMRNCITIPHVAIVWTEMTIKRFVLYCIVFLSELQCLLFSNLCNKRVTTPNGNRSPGSSER